MPDTVAVTTYRRTLLHIPTVIVARKVNFHLLKLSEGYSNSSTTKETEVEDGQDAAIFCHVLYRIDF